MDLHRVGRMANVLVTSQLRSGRAGSDPTSFWGRPALLAYIDAGLFLTMFALTELAVRSLGGAGVDLYATAVSFLPFVPLIAVAGVLIAGVMFELTATAKFSGSDAVNWMPLRPSEYVTASAVAIAYTYSPAIALFLGVTLPLSIAAGVFGAWLLAAVLAVVSLFEGAFLVEMVRASTQRVTSMSVGRRGHLTLIARAVVFIVLILALQLAFNPIFLLLFVHAFGSLGLVTALVPFFWGTQAVISATQGSEAVALAFAVATVAFSVLLLAIALRLRARYWVVSGSELKLDAIDYAAGHPVLRRLGLSGPEAAIVSKDLRGYVRRRELLPLLVVPIILILLVLIEGGTVGVTGAVVWAGWVAGFFALLLAVSSLGQERRALQLLFAFPLTARSILRAKSFSVLLPALVSAVVLGVAIGLLFHFPAIDIGGLIALTVGVTVVLALWGLVFASRFSDFQERPRPQYLSSSAMLGATLSGTVLLFAMVIPGAIALQAPVFEGLVPGIAAVAVALGAALVSFRLARTGFDRLFRELPF